CEAPYRGSPGSHDQAAHRRIRVTLGWRWPGAGGVALTRRRRRLVIGGGRGSGRPGAEGAADLPLVTGWVFDPAEPPTVLVLDRGKLRGTRGACLRDELVGVVDHEEHSARGAAILARA